MDGIIANVRNLATQKTTWVGIIGGIVGAIGIAITPELQNAIAVMLVSMVSTAFVVYDERKSK
jgi:hypothetical protein